MNTTNIIRRSIVITVCTCVLIPRLFGDTPPLRSTRYDGTAAHRMNFGASLAHDPSVAMTIEAWVYRDDENRCETIVGRDYTSSYWLGFCGGRLRFYRSGRMSADADRNVTAGSWTHVAASYDGTRVWFYVDGQPAGNPVLSNAGAGRLETLYLGGDAHSSYYMFKGCLDEVRIWSVARTQPQINGLRLSELTGDEPNLIFYQPAGGNLARGQIFGILPKNLVIPPAATPVTMDGIVSLASEYAGAEQLVIRYGSGSGVPDAVAHLVYRAGGGQTNLYVGVQNIRDTTGGWSWTNSFMAVHVDPNHSRNPFAQTNDFRIRGPLSLGLPNGRSARWNWGNGAGAWGAFPLPPSSTRWEVDAFQQELATPTMEFRVSGLLFEKFGRPFGFAAGHLGIGATGDDRFGPSDAAGNSPLTWASVTFGESGASLPTAYLAGYVYDGNTSRPVADRLITLYDETSRATLAVTTTDINGYYGFNQPVLQHHALKISVWQEVNELFLRHEPVTSGIAPTNLVPWQVIYPGCGSSSCSYQHLRHFIRRPIGPLAMDSFSPSNGYPSYVLRDSPLKELPASIVRIHGTNLHSEIRVYLYSCLAMPPGPGCVEGEEYFLADVTARAADETWIDVRVPSVPENMRTGYSWYWVVRDLWNRPGRLEWTRLGAQHFVFAPPPYPKLHSFEFENFGDGPSIEEFESIYGNNIFIHVPFPVRNPIYYSLWLPLYYLIGETAGRGGSCHGMAGASRLFANEILDVTDYDVGGSGGPSGVHYAAGFRSRSALIDGETEPLAPFMPANWTGFDLFQPYRPVDVWAQIRTYMMAQFAVESIDNYLSQMSLSGGNPVAVLNRLRSNPAGHTLCFNSGGLGTGHCVTPYTVVDGFKLDETDLANGVVPDASCSIIKVYDNNYPEAERHLEVNRVSNQFRYQVGADTSGAPIVWSGRSIFTVPLSLYTGSRHAPPLHRVATGLAELFFRFLCSGGADVQHFDASGQSWGWDAAGTFTNTYPGAIGQFPLFGPSTNRDQRSAVIAHLPVAAPPAKSLINVRGTNYLFHAGRGGQSLQLFAAELPSGGVDVAEVKFDNDRPTRLKLTAARAIGSLLPQIGQSTVEDAIVFSWRGVSLPAVHPVELRASSDGQREAGLANLGGTPLHCTLQVEAVHIPSGQSWNTRYRSINLPAGASVRLSFPDWPDVVQAVSELDFGDDGIIDLYQLLPAQLALSAERSSGQLVLRWFSDHPDDILEASDELGPGAKWTDVGVEPVVTGDLHEVTLPAGASQRFFRVRSQQ